MQDKNDVFLEDNNMEVDFASGGGVEGPDEHFIGTMEYVYQLNRTVLCYIYSDWVQRIGKKYRKMRSILKIGR